MECRDVRELADSYLSEQLLVETNHELLRHLETCPDCRGDMAGRRALRDGLRSAFARAEGLRPRPEFAVELMTTLRASQPGVSRRSVLRSWAILSGVDGVNAIKKGARPESLAPFLCSASFLPTVAS